jgi:hypothetical protein
VIFGGVDITLVRLLLSAAAVIALVLFTVWALRAVGR